MTGKLTVGTVALATIACPALAAAQERAADGGATRVLASFAECRRIAAADARLACFDKASAALEQAVAARDVRIVDRGDVRKARRSLFGLNLPSLGIFGGGDGDKDDEREAFTEINSTVQAARAGPNGRGEIVLADEGHPVWQTTEAMNFLPRAGAKVRVRRGAMGGYFINVDSRSYRAIRLR